MAAEQPPRHRGDEREAGEDVVPTMRPGHRQPNSHHPLCQLPDRDSTLAERATTSSMKPQEGEMLGVVG